MKYNLIGKILQIALGSVLLIGLGDESRVKMLREQQTCS
jgi:hypothetical protein